MPDGTYLVLTEYSKTFVAEGVASATRTIMTGIPR